MLLVSRGRKDDSNIPFRFPHCSCTAMEIKMLVLPNYPRNAVLRIPKFLRSRFLDVACLRSHSILWLYPRFGFFHLSLSSSALNSKGMGLTSQYTGSELLGFDAL
ncbi:hypothetical protein IFM89_019129 [Coptis chinensis]|uniref:Uncharacterized protein n=1 Tax=Coptis chinensis TaxID=261450 RepID=A0A835H6D8_9MAGN|nr:hypothetical protein IFM89_019129 [Coptis chinensis]